MQIVGPICIEFLSTLSSRMHEPLKGSVRGWHDRCYNKYAQIITFGRFRELSESQNHVFCCHIMIGFDTIAIVPTEDLQIIPQGPFRHIFMTLCGEPKNDK